MTKLYNAIKHDTALLEGMLRLLDEALKPREWPDMNREMTAACLAKTTSLTVSFTNEEPNDQSI